MNLAGEQTLLRIFIRNTLHYSWWYSAADALLRRAIRKGLVGEITLEGFLGLDSIGQVVKSGRWSLVKTRPLVLEFLDRPAAIGSFLPDVAEVVTAGLVTLERVRILAHRGKLTASSQPGANPAILGEAYDADDLPSPEEFPIMRKAVDGQLLRIFIDESNTYDGKTLYQAILGKAHGLGMTNAVVLRARMGFGTHRKVHTDRSPEYVSDLPILIEIVGTAEEINRLLPFLEEAIPEGMITIEDVKMLRFGEAKGS